MSLTLVLTNSGKLKFKLFKLEPAIKKIIGIIAATLINSNIANIIFRKANSFV